MQKRKQIRAFESSVEKLGRILSKKWDIKVVFGSKVPITTGKVIYLPTIPDDASQDFLTVIQGHLDHETSHVLFTDFNALKLIDTNDKKLYLLVNGIEDCRIEREYCEVWQGARSNLKKSLEWALIKMVQLDPQPAWPGCQQTVLKRRWDELAGLSKLIYFTTVFPQVEFDEDHWFVRDYVDPLTLQRVKDIVPIVKDAIAKGGSTVKVIEAARKIMEIWKSQEPERKPPPELPGPKPQPKPGEGKQEQTQKPAEELQPPQAPQEPPPQEPEPDVEKYEKLTSKAGMIKEEVEKSVRANPPKYAIYTTAGDVVEKIQDGDRGEYKSFMEQASYMVHVIKQNFTRSLRAQGGVSWEGGKARGRLDSRNAFKVALGTGNKVFKNKVVSSGFDTAVMMMVDHSGSMSREKIVLASATATMMGEALHAVGIPFSVAGFSTGAPGSGLQRKSKASVTDLDIYTRWGDLWLGIYKDFDESWTSVNHRMTTMPRNIKYNTYDGESLRWGARQLISRPEKRKILFWLNDGDPAPTTADDSPAHIAYTSESAKEVESVVEVVAIGIYSTNVKHYYKNCIIVNDIVDLPQLCVTELDALLRGKGETNGRQRRSY